MEQIVAGGLNFNIASVVPVRRNVNAESNDVKENDYMRDVYELPTRYTAYTNTKVRMVRNAWDGKWVKL